MKQTFKDVFRYYCPYCGEEVTGFNDDGTVTCTECGRDLRIGEGIAGTENGGDLEGKLFLICPVCHAESTEDAARTGEGFFTCPTCGFKGKHFQGLM